MTEEEIAARMAAIEQSAERARVRRERTIRARRLPFTAMLAETDAIVLEEWGESQAAAR